MTHWLQELLKVKGVKGYSWAPGWLFHLPVPPCSPSLSLPHLPSPPQPSPPYWPSPLTTSTLETSPCLYSVFEFIRKPDVDGDLFMDTPS